MMLLAIFIILGLLVACAVGLVIKAELRYHRQVKLHKQATDLCEVNDYKGALAALLESERCWNFRLRQQTPSDQVSDLNRLRNVYAKVAGMPTNPAMNFCAHAAIAVIDQLCEILQNNDNFRRDGRMMKPNAAMEWSHAWRELQANRLKFQKLVTAIQK